MITVDVISSDSIEIKGSKFIAFLMPMALYSSQIEQLRSLHPKAVHFVSAYRYLNEFDQVVEYAGDDGEPKGTSGKPTLSVLQGHDLINVAIITVRYFGGTKLGPGGLVRAYAEAANGAASAARLLAYEKLLTEVFTCAYKHVSIVEYEIMQHTIHCISKSFDAKGSQFKVEATSQRLESFFAAMGRIIIRR